MTILQIEIIDPRAETLLHDLAEMNLIHIGHGQEKTPPTALRRQAGWGKGTFRILPSFYEPLEEFKDYE